MDIKNKKSKIIPQTISSLFLRIYRFYKTYGFYDLIVLLITAIYRRLFVSYKFKAKLILRIREKEYQPIYNKTKFIFIVRGLTNQEVVDFEKSMRSQFYDNWEIIAEDCSVQSDKIKSINELCLSGRDYCFIINKPVIYHRYALAVIDKQLNNKDADIVYFDEDIVYKRKHYNPQFKPDFNKYYLLSYNYIGTLYATRIKSKNEVIQVLNNKIDETWFHSKLIDSINDSVYFHVPSVLVSTIINNKKRINQVFNYDCSCKSTSEYFLKNHQRVKVCKNLKNNIISYSPVLDKMPMVSIVIPNYNHILDLKRCINSIKKQNYNNYEIIIVENNSDDQNLFDYYDELNKIAKVIYWKYKFNFSAINNYGALYTKGKYLLFLNNDIELCDSEYLYSMVSYLEMDPSISIIGNKLLYPDNKIQHAGVVIGLSGVAGHIFSGWNKESNGYMNRLICVQEYLAVTAASMMIRKDDFVRVSGFDEKLEVAYNDVDLCLKIQQINKKVLFVPNIVAYHYESKSRGSEDSQEKLIRYDMECKYFCNKWEKYFKSNDPYYSRFLFQNTGDNGLSLRNVVIK